MCQQDVGHAYEFNLMNISYLINVKIRKLRACTIINSGMLSRFKGKANQEWETNLKQQRYKFLNLKACPLLS